MFNTRRTWLTKTIVVALLLATSVLAGCLGPRGWPGTAYEGDTLYVGTMKGALLALNPVNGAEEWLWEPLREQTGSAGSGNLTAIANAFLSCSRGGVGQFQPGYFYGAPVIANGTVYISYFTGSVYAIDATMGEEVWEHDIKGNVAGGLSVVGDTIYIGSSNGKLSALDAGNGSLKWEFSAQDEIWSTPTVVDGVVYFGSLDHSLYALNAADGKERWEFETGGGIGSTPLVVGGTVYVGSFDHKFYAVDADTGALKWVFDGAGDWFWSEAVYDNGTIYVNCLDHNVYALDAGNGTPIWPRPFNAGDEVKASPVITSGLLVVAAVDGKIYGLDLKTGNLEWEFDSIKAKVLAPLCAAENIVYINSQDNKLHALYGENGFQFWTVSLSQ
jgi:outer membrane protein assembly factor BamB